MTDLNTDVNVLTNNVNQSITFSGGISRFTINIRCIRVNVQTSITTLNELNDVIY